MARRGHPCGVPFENPAVREPDTGDHKGRPYDVGTIRPVGDTLVVSRLRKPRCAGTQRATTRVAPTTSARYAP